MTCQDFTVYELNTLFCHPFVIICFKRVTFLWVTTAGAVQYGDANGDKKVTVADAVAILQYIANKDKFKLSETGKKNADCYNVDDGITANDALAIQKPDAKMITSLPFSSND